MKICTSFRRFFPHLVVGIGNFDGFHRGHHRIIEGIKRMAGPKGTPGIITFRDHTRLTEPREPGMLLTTVRQRLNYFREAGIAVCWLCDFNESFAGQPPRDFVVQMLVGRLGIEGICVGAGFHFGRDRRGTVALLERLGREFGFRVREVPTVRVGGREVRSSVIRKYVRDGDLARATELLGHEYCLTGRVIRGHGRGKTLGYPTANFNPEQLLPAHGVYAARIRVGDLDRPGMLYVGSSPTFPSDGRQEVIAEAYIFDWIGALGGRRIKVYLKKRLREDITFPNAGALSRQIRKDEERARRLYKKTE